MTTNLEENEELEGLIDSKDIERYNLVGSTYILGKGKDIDYLVQVPILNLAYKLFGDMGYKTESDEKYNDLLEDEGTPQDSFISFRKNDINLIVVANDYIYNSFVLSAKVCRHVKAEDKQMRIDLHQLIMNGKIPETYPVF